jgi:[ribosomal protein S18]-alanine N-acetyltransferase
MSIDLPSLPVEIEYRALSSDDIEELAQISECVPFGGSWTREKLATELADAQGLGIVIKGRQKVGQTAGPPNFEGGPGQLAAFVLYRRLGEVLEISWLATAVGWQKQGLMSCLLRQLAGASKAPGGPVEIWLEVHEKNLGARNLYEKLGFRVTSRRPNYYPDGGAAILLSWKLSST